VLGFAAVQRPQGFEFDGAWLCGRGIEVHLIQDEEPRRIMRPINPKSDHLSFLCHDMDLVERVLVDHGVEYVNQTFSQDGLHQVSRIQN
jgi:hypothetical protein